jgi:glycosyltransferase involved in cell wall biosynthesis
MSSSDVLQIAPNAHPPFLDICRAHADALAQAGVRVTTIFLEGDEQVAGEPGMPCLARHGVYHGYREAAAELRHVTRGTSFAWILCHRYKSYRVAVALQPRRARAGIIAFAHEFGFFDRRRRRWHQRWFGRGVRFAGVSDAVADDLARTNRDIPRPLVIPNPIDIDAFERQAMTRADARALLGIDEDVWLLGWIGRLHPKKDPVSVVAALHRALPQLPGNTRLVMIGDGELAAPLSRQRAELGLTAHIVLPGRLPGAARLLPAFDVLVFSCGAKEAFGMVLLEAMVAKTLIISASSPGPRSVLGDWGIFYPTGDVGGLMDALVAAAQMPEAGRSRLRSGARARAVAEYSLPAAAERYRALLGLSMVGLPLQDVS